jgi:branched-chain amino acid aminotransferase
MLDMNGNVAEGPGANFFYEKDGVLFTPPLGHILPGITRETVINICRELEIPLVEKYFTPEDMEGMDSAFMCGTAAEIIGVQSIDARPMQKKWKESLGSTIQEVYKNIVLEKSYADTII